MARASLKKRYYDGKRVGSLGGARSLHAALGLKSSAAKKKSNDWLSGQDAYTLHRRVVSKFPRRSTIVRGLGVQLQADLMDVRSHREDNDNITFLLVAIDVFSRKLYVRPIASKSGVDVVKELDHILDKAGGRIRQLQTDKGKEFFNKHVAKMLERRGIKHYSSENETIKASLVERVNRTLRDRIHRHLTATNKKHYLDVLAGLVRSYNRTVNRAIGMAPNRVSYSNQEMVWNRLHSPSVKTLRKRLRKRTPLFSSGDHVRISKARSTFERGYTANWMREIFVIANVITDTTPYT
jgi:transposase InsO family protein